MAKDPSRQDLLPVPSGRPTGLHPIPRCKRPLETNVTFDQLADAYYAQIAALVEGGGYPMPETTFDTLNLKADFCSENFFDSSGQRLPVILSVTITDASGRTCPDKPQKRAEFHRP